MSTSASVIAHQFGAAFLGVIVGAVLFGITILQTLLYFKDCAQDKIYYKISVGVLCFLDALHLAFSVHMIYHYLVNSAGSPDPTDTVIWSLKALAIVNVIVIWMVQCLYSVRVWQLSSATSRFQPTNFIARAVLIVVSGVALAALGVGCAFIAEVTQLSDLTVHHWWLYMGNATSALIDTTLAVMMVAVVYRCHFPSKSDNVQLPRRSLTLLSGLVQYCIATGLLTSIAAIVMLILYSIRSDNLAYLAFVFAITKLYVNSFIAILNARKHLLRSFDQTPITIDLRSMNVTRKKNAEEKKPIDRLALNIGMGENLVTSTQRRSQMASYEQPLLIGEISPSTGGTLSPETPFRAPGRSWSHNADDRSATSNLLSL